MVVQLPGDKQIVIDAKVPLSAFLAAQELAGAADGSTDAVAGAGAQIGESRPHADVTADPRAVPNASEGSVGLRR